MCVMYVYVMCACELCVCDVDVICVCEVCVGGVVIEVGSPPVRATGDHNLLLSVDTGNLTQVLWKSSNYS